MLNKERLEEIRARVNAATPGPWEACLGSGIAECTAIMHQDGETGENFFVADCMPDYALDWASEDHLANLEFIAHARQDIPDLLAEIAELKKHRSREKYIYGFQLLKSYIVGYRASVINSGIHPEELLLILNDFEEKIEKTIHGEDSVPRYDVWWDIAYNYCLNKRKDRQRKLETAQGWYARGVEVASERVYADILKRIQEIEREF